MPKVGDKVYVWPTAVIDSAPDIGFIVEVYDGNVCRIARISKNGGSVMICPSAHHKDDPRLRGVRNEITPLAKWNGCWQLIEDECCKECPDDSDVKSMIKEHCEAEHLTRSEVSKMIDEAVQAALKEVKKTTK